MINAAIIDGYVDEPACLGVPPYISPYPRYISGAILDFDKNNRVIYYTIDQIRNDISLLNKLRKFDIIVVVAGMLVPGRYLSGFPVSPKELKLFFGDFNSFKVLCGPAARYGFGLSGGHKTRDAKFVGDIFDLIITGDPEIVIYDLFGNKFNTNLIELDKCRADARTIRNFAIKGSDIVIQHPFFPDHLITEIETYRGCPRGIVGGCSFCSEPLKGLPDFRPIEDVVDEIERLYNLGVRHFRIGSQPCIFSYLSKEACRREFPRPNTLAIEKLFKGIRTVAPELHTLHIDNANPGTIASYPKESKEIAKTIIKYHTPGDVAAFGVESFDEVVAKKNNLKANKEDIFLAIKLLNDVGGARGYNGLPELLPGLNILLGLDGETKDTYDINFECLKYILDSGLLLRRINIRQIIPIPGTKMFKNGNKILMKNKKYFYKFKNYVKVDVERPMLQKILPLYGIIKNVYTEKHVGHLTYGRQMGSYPILIGIPGVIELNHFIDVKTVDYGYRSITAVPFPLNINTAHRCTIEALPRIGKKRSVKLMLNRPYKEKNDVVKIFDDASVGKDLLHFISV